jgi:hypothetical protein
MSQQTLCLCGIWRSHDGDYEEYYHLGCDAV